jgi:SAM-dependent methyltransferase
VALVTWSAEPVLALNADDGPRLRAGVGRLVDRWAENLRTWAAYPEARLPDASDGSSPPPVDAVFEDRVDACPWCGSAALLPHVDAHDLNQFKPGTFHLDRCTDCGHIFQNPQLTLEGLSYYYADVYDGVGEEMLEHGLSTRPKRTLYDGRVELVASVTEPSRWLDVGTGHAHFCQVARERWPEARFDGIDQSDSVLKARDRRRIDGAHLGQFPEVAPRLAGTYDVVSMNHYLEHARDPRAEIAAAATVLAPDGHLLIEGPDAASPWGRRLRGYWICWLQPQHLHFIPFENLVTELERAGFEVVASERATAGEGFDVFMGAAFLAQHRAGHGRLVPWLPVPTPAHRVRRFAVFAACAPLLTVASVVDLVKDSWARRPGSTAPGNAYRLVARKR